MLQKDVRILDESIDFLTGAGHSGAYQEATTG